VNLVNILIIGVVQPALSAQQGLTILSAKWLVFQNVFPVLEVITRQQELVAVLHVMQESTLAQHQPPQAQSVPPA
jgi:hypothetical protein